MLDLSGAFIEIIYGILILCMQIEFKAQLVVSRTVFKIKFRLSLSQTHSAVCYKLIFHFNPEVDNDLRVKMIFSGQFLKSLYARDLFKFSV